MPEPIDDSRFADSFIEDFFAESDEHLTVIRRDLLALERTLPGGQVPPAILEELFRTFHSLKGISGMVGLEPAELLAHEMESYLRALTQGDISLSTDGIEALAAGTGMLDAVIGARREGRSSPDVTQTCSRIAALAGPAQQSGGTRAQGERPAPARAGGETANEDGTPRSDAPVWRVMFVPSNDLLARGVNVNVIRERLRGIGDILDARPQVRGEGGIAFQFLVRTPSSPEAFDEWRDDGLSYERAQQQAPEGPGVEPPRKPDDQAASLLASTTAGIGRVVRVDLARLDDVMRVVADIVVTRSRLDEALDRVQDRVPHGDWRALQDANQALERQLRQLRDGVMRVRLVRVGEIFGKMPFVVRDLSRGSRKQVTLDLRGQDTEVDKFLIERMMDPILHLVRNAISHGIEPPEERLARGKPPGGTIGLHAATVGEMIVLEVEDDGCGIDAEAVKARARQAGLSVPAQVDAATLLDLLCTPGLSTREEADRAAGRGVGMAVVKETVEQLAGTMELQSEPGRGTRFVLTMPVTLAITDALVVRVAGHRFAIPQSAVREVLEVNTDAIRAIERNELFPYRESVLPLVRLADLLNLPSAAAGARLHVFVVGTGAQAVGLGVDRIIGQREIVVRAVSDPLMRVEGVSGATELGDGQPILILDPAALGRMARRQEKAVLR